ncbi:MAG: VOC family protein [Pseudomonas sp.]|jgi:catechol 2,3-dioxygenase-like lactoylglutathione lyase family enzyme|uniref:Catechol 2,3-dioxygenase n=1 Tax=Ectopseudomonas composti TaxID=658457 RepID=A0A1I5MCN5_9GAMM|nr:MULTISPECIES: VOC family protein [Pseudomonas]MDN5517064.1 VOC family protein [Pseudomonas sp.]QNH06784.1 VOC family protein [Pseudomonas sp. B11D7D]SFP07280.1 Catechol 2,3-dioxygenase [Pseudomonas composti]
MFSHICIGVSDFPRALRFYQPLMDLLGVELRLLDAEKPWAVWQSSPEPRPLLLISTPYDGAVHHSGNGQMVALLAQTRAQVDQAHRLALAQGGRCEGAPGLRVHYHPDYYGAYFRDLDGNKLCVVCHRPE